MTLLLKSTDDIRVTRLRVSTQRIPVIVAALWPKKGVNLGTLGRTVDAVGAWMVTPASALANRSMMQGNTIGQQIPWSTFLEDPYEWLQAQDARKIAIEITTNSIPVSELEPWTGDTVLVLGNEAHGIPQDALDLCDEAVEIPMSGVGNSLNVAVAASIVLYKLAGLL